MSAPIHDDFENAIVVTELPFTHITDTSGATTAEGDPYCAGQGPTVWYAFTASEDTLIEANTFGSDYDTTLSAYLDTGDGLVQIACNDDAAGAGASKVSFSIYAGQTVYFMVGAYASGPGGNLTFNLHPTTPPTPLNATLTIDAVGAVDPVTGYAAIRGTFTCTRPTYVDFYGMLRDRIGRVRVEASFGGFYWCDGTGTWDARVVAPNALLVPGPAEVEVAAYFFDPENGEGVSVEQSATVRLQASRLQTSTSDPAATESATQRRVFESLDDVIRHDERLLRKAVPRKR